MLQPDEEPKPATSEVEFCRGFWRCVRGDIARFDVTHKTWGRVVILILSNRGFHAILLYRVAAYCQRRHIPLLPLICSRLSHLFFAIDISPRADLGPGITIVHGFGVVVGSQTRVEGDCCIFHGVTLGDRGSAWVGSDLTDGHPLVGSGVMFGAGAKVLGPVVVGDNSVIGANAVVLKDVPPCSVVAGVPARVVGRSQAAKCRKQDGA